MPARKTSKRALLTERIRDIGEIDETLWADLKRELAPVSDSYLRSLLKQSGPRMVPLVEGVHISDLPEAERTLRAIAAEYEGDDAARRKLCRNLVIEAKQRARWRIQREGAGTPQRALSEEILLWTSTWLDNPLLFADWVSLRQKRLSTENRTPQP